TARVVPPTRLSPDPPARRSAALVGAPVPRSAAGDVPGGRTTHETADRVPDPDDRAPRRPQGRGRPRRAADAASAAAAPGGRPIVDGRPHGSAPGAAGMRPPSANPALKGIPGFRDASSPVSVTYSGRCRMIAAEVAARCARMENASDPGEG